MKKQIKGIIILVVVLIVLVAGNIIIKSVSSANTEKREKESEEESLANVIYINDFQELSSISFGGFSFTCADDSWSYDGDGDFPVDSTIIKSVASEFSGLTASRKIENGDTLDSYGLETPAYTVELDSSDGQKQTLYIGNSYNGEYYVKTSDSGTIYTCSLTTLDTLAADKIEYFAVIDSVNSVWSSTYYSFCIDGGDKSILLTKDRSVDVYSEDETDEAGEKVPNVVWDVSLNGADPYAVTDTLDLSNVRNALDFTYDSCLAYNAGDDELSEYGFDEPLYVITIGYTDENEKDCELELIIGAYDEESGMYSVMSNQANEIYGISSSTISTISECFDYDFLASDDSGELEE